MASETIERAAIRHCGEVYSLPRPARHHDVAHWLSGRGARGGVQGFVTSKGRFVGRREAMRIAEKAGQLRGEPYVIGELFSEDVW